MSAPDRVRARLLTLAEVTLVAVTLAAVLGLGGLFADGSFVPKVAAAAVLGHGLAAACRRRRLGALPTATAALVGAGLMVSWLHLWSSTVLGVPAPETLRQLHAQLDEAWGVFGAIVAPAPVLPGFVLAASLGVWFIAFAADSAAFRVRATLEAIVPAGTMFVFGGALGTGDHRVTRSAVFLGAALLHWLAQRSLASASSPTWLASDAPGGVRSLLGRGVALGAVGVLMAVLLGPLLPGARADALIPWRSSDRDEDGSRVTISPLVDIRSRLVDQADVEVFRVRSDQRSYWRLTSLERFDGRIWSSNRQYRRADGTLRSDVEVDGARVQLATQEFTIGALSSIWLPAAFRPVRVEGAEARYDAGSNSLLTKEDTPTGATYRVRSALPRIAGEQLAAVPAVAPQEIADEYLALPPGFSPRVQQLAGAVTAGARTQYDKALALQSHFRDGGFTYDLDVDAGHSGNHLERFLFELRRGYCEQFAGAYAAMARAAGLPARVAVGFTPGEVDPVSGEYVVRGFNGHAWPEVYLEGFGWVPFEPTPGRGMPGAQDYTGNPEAQATQGDPMSATTLPTTTTTTVAGSPAAPASTAPGPPPPAPEVGQEEDSSPWPGRITRALVVGLGVPLSWVLTLAVLRTLRRRRRRASAGTPARRVLVAWDEATEALARAGAAHHEWETPSEYAVRAGRITGADAALLQELADLTTTAAYGPDGVPEAAAEDAFDIARRLEDAAGDSLTRAQRLKLLADPRPLLPARRALVDLREAY